MGCRNFKGYIFALVYQSPLQYFNENTLLNTISKNFQEFPRILILIFFFFQKYSNIAFFCSIYIRIYILMLCLYQNCIIFNGNFDSRVEQWLVSKRLQVATIKTSREIDKIVDIFTKRFAVKNRTS